MQVQFRAAFIAGETNATPHHPIPPHPSLLSVPSNIVDQKQIVLHVTRPDQNVLFMFHLQTDAGWGSQDRSAVFISICLDGPKSIPVGGDGGSFEIYVGCRLRPWQISVLRGSVETGLIHLLLFDRYAKANIHNKSRKTDTFSLIFPNLFC